MYNPAESHINVIMQLVRELFELRRIEQFTPSEFRQNCIRQFTRRSFFFFFFSLLLENNNDFLLIFSIENSLVVPSRDDEIEKENF